MDGWMLLLLITDYRSGSAALPPQILQFPEDMKIMAGEKVEILCKFSGAPPINCTWLKFRKPVRHTHVHLYHIRTHTNTHMNSLWLLTSRWSHDAED